MRIPQPPPDYLELLAKIPRSRMPSVHAAQDPAPGGKYRHWDTLRHLAPPPPLTAQEWWCAVKLARRGMLHDLPLTDGGGRPFAYATPDPALRMLHRIDRDAAGEIRAADRAIASPDTRDYFLVKSLVEEAIRSSQLEGASTTRQVAAQMIESGRAPRDRDERMIMNNYVAIEHIRDLVGQPLTPERVIELQRILTLDTLRDASASGRLRRSRDAVVVQDEQGQLLHTPPPASTLPRRLAEMCRFANAPDDDEPFLHPVARAVLLHFWLAYDHPFVDGNGRTARAFFYWCMLSRGYWLSEYISISRVLSQAPARYSRAFLYGETDGNDATYFLLFQLAVIRRAIADLHAYLGERSAEVRAVEAAVRRSVTLNDRQILLLSEALRAPGAVYTIAGHRKLHNVVYQTARTDLLDLAGKGLLLQFQAGRGFAFSPAPDLSQRLRRLR